LVALFDRDDVDHPRVAAFFGNFEGQYNTTLAVITEVMHLLDFSQRTQQEFLKWAFAGGINLVQLTDDDGRRTIELHAKYADRPMDLADATLVAVAERMNIAEALTLDSDFRIYRLHGRRAFSLPLLDAAR
jgi:predicted nucleic acid-binding protein